MGHGAVGAAEVGFNPYSNYQNRTDAADFMPEGANAARPVDMPKVDPTGRQVRSGAKTIYGTEAANRIASRHAGANTNINSEITPEVTDPMEFAVRETMKPSPERQAMDQAIEDTANWMLGKEKTAAAEAETLAADTTRFDIKILENLNKARNYFIDYAKTHFPTSVVNKETGKTVDISRKGLDKFLSGRISEEKYASGFHIPELIERAYKVDTANNYHADQVGNAPTYEYYDSPIKIGNTDYTAHIRVKNSVMGDKYYGHTISEVDNIEIEPSARTSVPGKPAVQPVHAIDDSISTIPHSNQNVNQNQETNLDNDMGAKKSDFVHETKRSKGNTTPDYEAANNVPESARTDPDYIAVTEAESNHNAKLRLDQDYDGEVEELRRKAAWSAEEMYMGRMILDDLRADADASGDYSAYQDWAKVFEVHKQEGGRALQNLAQINRRTGAGIMQEAASILDDGALRKGVDSNAVMNEISEDANRFDAARTSKNVDGLVQLIKDTAAERNTGFRRRKDGTQKQSKYLNWALDRIAGYAKSGKLTGNVDPNLQIDASNIQNPDAAFQFLQDFASTGILNIAADTQKASTGTKLMSLRRSGMLSKLSTAMRNLGSNSGFNIVDTIIQR